MRLVSDVSVTIFKYRRIRSKRRIKRICWSPEYGRCGRFILFDRLAIIWVNWIWTWTEMGGSFFGFFGEHMLTRSGLVTGSHLLDKLMHFLFIAVFSVSGLWRRWCYRYVLPTIIVFLSFMNGSLSPRCWNL